MTSAAVAVVDISEDSIVLLDQLDDQRNDARSRFLAGVAGDR